MALTKVSGNILDPGINVAGVVTATRFDGPFSDLTTTELDVTGISTFKNDVEFVGPTAGITSSYWDKSANEFKFKDGVKLSFGDGRDLQLQHNGSDSVISQSAAGTGDLKILSGGAQSIECIKAGAVNIAHNGNTKLTTTGYGVTITGGVTVGAALTVQGDLYVEGTRTEVKSATLEITDKTIGISSTASPSDTTADGAGIVVYGATDKKLTWENSSDSWLTSEHIKVPDNKRLKLGSDQDMFVFHDNIHGYVSNRKANLYLEAPTYVMITSTDTNGSGQQTSARFLRGGKSEIYHSNSVKFETSSTGISVTGEVAATQDYPNYRPTLDLNFAAVKKLDSRITYSRTGPASYVDKFGLVRLVGSNEPRFDHDPSTRECKGFLIEESRINILPYSTDVVGQSAWARAGVLTENTTATTAPDGSYDAVALRDDGSNGQHTLYDDVAVGNITSVYTSSCWAKAGSQSFAEIFVNGTGASGTVTIAYKFNLSTGAATYTGTGGFSSGTSAIATEYPNGWWRLSVTGDVADSASGSGTFRWHVRPRTDSNGNYQGDNSIGIYVWGLQLELGTFLTSYIPGSSTGGTATRGEDIATIDGTEFTDFFNATEGTSVVHAHMPVSSGASGLPAYAFKNSGVSQHTLQFSRDNNSSPTYHYYHDGSNTSFTRASATGDNMYKGAMSFKTGDLDSYVNGTVNANTTSFTMPPFDNLRFGGVGGANTLGGHIARFMYYPVKLTNNQLMTLTS